MISIIIIFSASNDSNNTKHNECNDTMIIMFINYYYNSHCSVYFPNFIISLYLHKKYILYYFLNFCGTQKKKKNLEKVNQQPPSCQDVRKCLKLLSDGRSCWKAFESVKWCSKVSERYQKVSKKCRRCVRLRQSETEET